MRYLKITKLITKRETRSLDAYFAEIGKYAVLSPEEEEKVAIQAYHGSAKARERLVTSNLRFVVSVAKTYDRVSVPLEDLINEGNIGLMKAAELFDPTRGFKFISYAVWWIRQAIVQYLQENLSQIRRPSNVVNLLNKYNSQKDKMFAEGEILGEEEFMDKMGFTEKQKRQFRQISIKEIRGDKELAKDSTETLFDMMSVSDGVEELGRTDQIATIEYVLKTKLNEREYDCVKRCYGIGCEEQSCEEIARIKNVSRERVRQICVKAIDKLRNKECMELLREYL